MFGHLKGSFTSAVKDRQGKFEAANDGTLFLDEIGDMSLAAQAKVLRALEENKIQRVGSQKDISVDVRVIAATNKNLKKEIENGNFRAIKIIHGHGTGALKKEVREWSNYNEGRFQSIIYGEDYDLFDKNSVDFQFVENRVWLSGFVNYKVGIDGISILFVVLTTLITPLCVISVNSTITYRLKDFLLAILIMESLMIGVFCSLDLVIFYLFFEGGLIPMFLIIGIWGGDRRVYSAFKFFLYTLLGSVLMLVAIITIYWITGTTDVEQLYILGIDQKYQNLLWLAFFSSFAVKTPMWPVHTWLPDAHVEAPTAGSVLLAAILLKMAGYGFIRFSLGLFPVASEIFTPLIYILSVIAIIFKLIFFSFCFPIG